MKNNRRYIHILTTSLRLLRHAYEKQAGSGSDEFSQWLCDNYYMLEKQGAEVLRALESLPGLRASDSGVPLCVQVCRDVLSDACLPSQEELERVFAEKCFTTAELAACPAIVRGVLLEYAARSCGKRDVVILSNAVKSLSNVSEIDFEGILEECSAAEKILAGEKCGVYGRCDKKTRSMYRTSLCRAAASVGESESEYAEKLVMRADAQGKHVGEYLCIRSNRKVRGTVFIALQILIPAVVCVAVAVYLRTAYALLMYLPFWEVAKCILDRLAIRGVSPQYLPRFENGGRVCADSKTVIAVSVLLPDARSTGELKKHLEQLRRTNGGQNVKICVLADLKSSKVQTRPEDETDIASSRRLIQSLNKKYGGGFILAVRPRVYCATQREYTGKERKRGAITELARALTGEKAGFMCFEGDTDDCGDYRYICALDSDTRVPLDSVAQLTAVAAHPLNSAVVKDGKVVRGCGVFAPVVGVSILPENATSFLRVMAGESGVSAYSSGVSEFYQDLYGKGIFCGKGLIDIRAFLEVLSGRLPQQRILSHDILEGELLGTALVSDVEFTDSAPPDARAFFARQHRWVRGDWQNIAFIFGRGCTTDSKRMKMSALSRFKLADNLRRSLVPVVCALLLILSPFVTGTVRVLFVLCAVAGMTAGGVVGAISAFAHGGSGMLSRRFYSGVMPAAGAELARAFLRFMLLPQDAWCCADASVRALWRMLISKRGLLEWTVAAQSNKSSGALRFFVGFIPSFVCGLYLLLTRTVLLYPIGVLFAVSAFISYFMGREGKKNGASLSTESAEKLVSYSAAMWVFFDSLCSERDNRLPPDNIQEAPVFRIAHRTSPTNIGLALLAFLTARDLGFIDSAGLYLRVSRTLDTVIKLEKYEGNLLNWYNTQTLKPLYPRYVSSVDSGNFVCCLIVLRQGVLEYVSECPQLRSVADTVTRLICNTDVKVFYNERRQLFSIGIDAESGERTNSYYDLLMSEARMLGYYAVSARLVPKKHWGALSRILARDGRYTGPMSWTGTMFEYYLPSLFLPVYKNTLEYEAMSFCLHCQRRRTRAAGVPFGISESGFYAFDSRFDFRYKAHGVQKLALSKGLDKELVVSPYSTFIMMPFQPELAVKNLGKLEKYGALGRFGFYEAVDFTPRRLEGQEYRVVRSFMAHHIGMSLLGAANTLIPNVTQKRFMRDEEMSAGSFMLNEKISSGERVFSDVYEKNAPVRSRRQSQEGYVTDSISPTSPTVRLYSNGEWASILGDGGYGMSIYRGLCVTRRFGDIVRRQEGVTAYFVSSGRSIAFGKQYAVRSKAAYSAEFSSNSVKYRASVGTLECSQGVSVCATVPGEARTFAVKNNSASPVHGALRLYFEPSLAVAREATSHPVFSKMFISALYDSENKLALFSRRNRETGERVWLAAGFAEENEFTCVFDREAVLSRPNAEWGLAGAGMIPGKPTGGTDVCFFCETEFVIQPHRQHKSTLLMVGAQSRSEAVERITYLRKKGAMDKTAPAAFSESSMNGIIANAALSSLFYGKDNSREHIRAVTDNTLEAKCLWEMGVSGDNPLMLVKVQSEEDVERIAPYADVSLHLGSNGIAADTVIAFRDSGEYGSSLHRKIAEFIRERTGMETDVPGSPVRTVNLNAFGKEYETLLEACASYIAPTSGERLRLPSRTFRPVKINACVPAEKGKNGFYDGEYKIYEHPRLPWCHIICNRSFGTLVSDGALGFTYALNSRENRLTPWYNDTSFDNRGELLLLKSGGNLFDLALGCSVTYGEGYAVYSGYAGSIRHSIRITVPEKGMAKHLELVLENTSGEDADIEVMYYCEPDKTRFESSVRVAPEIFEGMLVKWNASSGVYGGYIGMGVREGANLYSCDRVSVLTGNWKKSLSLEGGECMAVGKSLQIKAGKKSSLSFYLTFGHTKESSVKQIDFTNNGQERCKNSIRITTPDSIFNSFFNTFLPRQARDCRLYARSGFYQSSGAYGFRDQLQDAAGLLLLYPHLCRLQIIRCCAVQFEKGDVLHWWHTHGSEGFRGARTLCGDDLLWLPLTVAQYVTKTGDTTVLGVVIPFLNGDELARGEREKYALYTNSYVNDTVYGHCMRALRLALEERGAGPTGLLLIGSGDWNDGFDRIGKQDCGESVWLTQFASLCARSFAEVSALCGDTASSEYLVNKADFLLDAVERNAFNGRQYMRAVLSDGEVLGNGGDNPCAIDGITQAFAVFSGAPDRLRRHSALKCALNELCDNTSGVVRLFTPAFTSFRDEVGYISAYPPGVRENGGQYTHAAVWLARALLQEGFTDSGWRLLCDINPAVKYERGFGDVYMTEPYAVSADVYSGNGREGRGGWSLYTGAAAWYFRTVCEELFGIRQRDGKLYFEPHLPESWDGCSAVLKLNGGEIRVIYEKRDGARMLADGVEADFLNPDGNNHTVSIKINK